MTRDGRSSSGNSSVVVFSPHDRKGTPLSPVPGMRLAWRTAKLVDSLKSEVTMASSATSLPQQAREGGRACCASTAPTNISEFERWMSLGAGGALTYLGLRHGTVMGVLSAGIGASLLYRGITGHCHAYEALGIDTADHRERTAVPAQQGVKIEKTMIVNRPARELYTFWRQLDNLPRVLTHVKQVRVRDDTHSHWIASGPLDMDVEWDAEVFNERENELIAWRSLPGGDIETAGSIHFRPLAQNRGTEVSISLKYNPLGGKVAAALAAWLGDGLGPILDEDLQRFKQTMEAGEATTTINAATHRQID
jgi:uncharacterized membrane protein